MVKVSGPLKPGQQANTPSLKPERVSLEGTLTAMRDLAVSTVVQAKADGTMNGARVVAAGVKEAHDRTMVILEREMPPGRKIDCKAGCTHCCHLPVVTDALTILAIADRVKNWPKTDRKQLLDRLREREKKRSTMSEVARRMHRAPCPMLVDDKCSVYEDRPLICRAFNSFDASRCERQYLGGGHPDGVDLYRLPYIVGEVLTEGGQEGLERAGLDAKDMSLDLGTAVLTALDEDHPAERFFAGEPVFKAARTTVKPNDPV